MLSALERYKVNYETNDKSFTGNTYFYDILNSLSPQLKMIPLFFRQIVTTQSAWRMESS